MKLQPLLTVEIDPTAAKEGATGGRLGVRVVSTQWAGSMADELLGTDMTTCNMLRWREVRPGLVELSSDVQVEVRVPVPDVPLMPQVSPTPLYFPPPLGSLPVAGS